MSNAVTREALLKAHQAATNQLEYEHAVVMEVLKVVEDTEFPLKAIEAGGEYSAVKVAFDIASVKLEDVVKRFAPIPCMGVGLPVQRIKPSAEWKPDDVQNSILEVAGIHTYKFTSGEKATRWWAYIADLIVEVSVFGIGAPISIVGNTKDWRVESIYQKQGEIRFCLRQLPEVKTEEFALSLWHDVFTDYIECYSLKGKAKLPFLAAASNLAEQHKFRCTYGVESVTDSDMGARAYRYVMSRQDSMSMSEEHKANLKVLCLNQAQLITQAAEATKGQTAKAYEWLSNLLKGFSGVASNQFCTAQLLTTALQQATGIAAEVAITEEEEAGILVVVTPSLLMTPVLEEVLVMYLAFSENKSLPLLRSQDIPVNYGKTDLVI